MPSYPTAGDAYVDNPPVAVLTPTRKSGPAVATARWQTLMPSATHWPSLAAGAAALVFFLWRLTTPALWLDEGATWSIASRSIAQLRAVTHYQDRFNEPYYAFMHVWMSVFGTSVLSMRLPSVIGCVAAVAGTAELGRRWMSPRAGLCAGLLLAAVPAVARYAQEARAYGLVVGLAVVTVLACEWIVAKPSLWRWLAYAVTVMALGLLHPFALALFVVNFVQLVRRASLRVWALTSAVAATPTAIVEWASRKQTSGHAWIPTPTWNDLLTSPTWLLDSVGVGFALLALVLVGANVRSRVDRILLVWALVPLLACFVVSDLARPVWVARYLLWVVPAWTLIAARALGGRWRAAVGVALSVALGWSTQLAIRTPAGHGEDNKAAVRYLEQHSRPGDALTYTEQWSQQLRYYLKPGLVNDVFADDRTAGESATLYRLERFWEPSRLDSVQRLWLVSEWGAIDPVLRTTVCARFVRVGGPYLFGSTRLSLWERTPDGRPGCTGGSGV
jgi:mannosyltransferase